MVLGTWRCIMKHTETREKVRSGPLKTDFLETFLKHPRRHTPVSCAFYVHIRLLAHRADRGSR